MVGTAYWASEPGAKPFIEVGSKVAGVTMYLGPLVGVPVLYLIMAGVLMGIDVVDHVVLGDARYCSFRRSLRSKLLNKE